MNDDNFKGFGCFIMFICGMALIFSIWSLLKWDNDICNTTGETIVITVLSVLVTFLVACQIYNTIIAKEQINGIKSEIGGFMNDVIAMNHLTQARNQLQNIDQLNKITHNIGKSAVHDIEEALLHIHLALHLMGQRARINRNNIPTVFDIIENYLQHIEAHHETYKIRTQVALNAIDGLIDDIEHGSFIPLEINRTQLINRLQKIREQLSTTIESH